MREIVEPVRPRRHEVLHEQGGPIAHVYFPADGVFSLGARMADGTSVITLAVGNEGVIGLPAIMGAGTSPLVAICQIPGWTLRVPRPALHDTARVHGVLFRRILRYAHAQVTSLAQSAACNRLHSATQRYARWLLTTHDRAKSDDISLTQASLAEMLGVSRQTVSEVARALEDAEIIHCAQGRITVDNRVGLEAHACECYQVVRTAFDELLGVPRG
jgi:CRP-like cAMP-binding protein